MRTLFTKCGKINNALQACLSAKEPNKGSKGVGLRCGVESLKKKSCLSAANATEVSSFSVLLRGDGWECGVCLAGLCRRQSSSKESAVFQPHGQCLCLSVTLTESTPGVMA